MKNILKCAAVAAVALLCAGTSCVYASAVIDTSAAGTTYLGLSDQATWLPQGDLVMEGSFIGGSLANNASISALQSGGSVSLANFATLLANFTKLNAVGSGVVGAGTAYDGTFDISFTGSQTQFGGTPIYLLAFNAATTAAATQVGVYVLPSNAQNEFPADMASGSTAVTLDNATLLIGSSLAGLTNPYDVDQNFNSPGSDTMYALTNVIPEPSSITLVVLGLLGGFGMIRRRRA